MLICLEQNRTLILYMFYTCLLVYILLLHSYLVLILSNFSSSYFTFFFKHFSISVMKFRVVSYQGFHCTGQDLAVACMMFVQGNV